MKPIRPVASLLRYILLSSGLFMALAFASLQPLPAAAHSTQRTQSTDTTAFIRVIHASPDIGTVDVFVDGSKVLSSFQYAAITGYVPLPAGPHRVQLALIGKGPGAAVISQTLSVQAGQTYTVAGVGTKATGFSLMVFTDNNFVSGNVAKVRVYQLSPTSGAVNVATSNGTVVSGLTYQQASNYISVTPGSYTFNITASQANTTFPVQAMLKQWTVTSIFAIGLVNSTPKLQFVAAQVSGTPGLPGTGSDPNPAAVQIAAGASTSPTTPIVPIVIWLLASLVLAAIGVGVTKRYVKF